MKKSQSYLIILTFVSGIIVAQDLHREVKRTNEKEVKVKIEASFGSVNIEKGSKDKIVNVLFKRKKKDNDPKLDLNYYLNKNVGDLTLEMHPDGAEVRSSNDGDAGVNVHLNNFDFNPDEWYVQLVEGIPLSIDAELGAGKSDFDFSGLIINDLSISTGASSSKLRFDEKNSGEIKTLRIESGVSKFVADNLNNANFQTLEFEGGVGAYILDFGGELKKEVKVDINVGLGAITLLIPKDIGVKVKYEDNWFSNLSLDDEEFIRKKKGIYESTNYITAEGKMNILIESGLGSVKVKRTR
ncbi:MAG: LiaF-related protein [Bacteroidota bacterium]|nr:LiaF-related protein [Bacteroidota bacterium]